MVEISEKRDGGSRMTSGRPDRLALFSEVSGLCSRITTTKYSTSFSKSIKALAPDIQSAIYAIYGFVRLADEIVDSFHGFERAELFDRIKKDTYQAIDERISINPILHSFQITFHQYGIEREHVELFLNSMEQDLEPIDFNRDEYDSYITGSAEVVGLMCLKVFVRGNEAEYQKLAPAAIRLGAAFQKVNFLRDINEDFQHLGRSYFPGIDLENLDEASKKAIEDEIEEDLRVAYEGLIQLPKDTRFGVYLAYTYYKGLLKRIRNVSSHRIMRTRIRVPDLHKYALMATSYSRHRLNLL